MTRVTLLIGIVSYRSGEALLNCLKSIFSNDHQVQLKVCVVDNDPQSGDGREAKAKFPQIRVINSPRNEGYGAGMNRAFRTCPSKYFLILNPDILVEDQALDALVNRLENRPSTAAAGPRLSYPDGSLYPSARQFPTLGLALLQATELNLRFPETRILRNHTYGNWDHTALRSVDWVTGAALMVRSDLFREVGGFDPQYFMYSEELDLCRRIHDEGLSIEFLPDARMVHLHAHSTRNTRVRQVEFYKSLFLYFRKHHGWVHALFIRFVLLMRQIVYILVVTFRYLLNRDRTAFQDRIQPAFKLLHWILRCPSILNTQPLQRKRVLC